MCGIAGMLNIEVEGKADPDLLKRMCDAITHRGPDEEGFYLAGKVGLGIRRLKIIDLSGGSQPIHNEDRSVWVVFNGEIYNYRELRVVLEKKGHRFYTQTDTESIVHLYEEYGSDCVHWLRGMFAFAIWDANRSRLLLARDRVGEKQLYFSIYQGRLLFGSEIKSLLACFSEGPSIDLRSLGEFFTYLYIQGERTIFEGISRLQPGCLLLCENGKTTVTPYWKLDPRPQQGMTEDDAVGEFRSQFHEAVKLRLVSDVPLGAFLSGGIDSSAIVAEMALLSSKPVKTFTIGYEGDGAPYDERPYARLVAEKFGTEHHELVVKPDVADVLPTIIRSFDEPFGDSSAIPSYYISKMTKAHVTVALSGVGGDEVGAGYERYLGVLVAEQYKRVPRFIRDRCFAPLVRNLPDSRKGWRVIDRAKRFIRGVECGVEERYHRYISTFTPDELKQLFTSEVREQIGDGFEGEFPRAFQRFGDQDPLTQMLFSDLAVYLPDDLLVLTDRMSMAHSLEVRAPFLDHKLLEFVATVPSSLKLRGWTKKYLLKKAFAPILPRQVLSRSKKGFSVPLAAWFRGPLRPFLLDSLSGSRLKRVGYFDEKYVSTLLAEHLSCRHNHENKLWALLVFMMWHDLYRESGRI